MHDTGIWRAAQQCIKRYGDDAVILAAMRDNWRSAKRFIDAIELLLTDSSLSLPRVGF